jgi:hypothetical protein
MPKTEVLILKKIIWEVRTRILGKGRYQRNVENVTLCRNWNMDEELLV